MICFFSNSNCPPLPDALLELNATWDQLHLMITKSTTPDCLLAVYRLRDFCARQLTEGKDYMRQCEFDLFEEARLPARAAPTSAAANVSGGNIQLRGNNFTLITFHGQNFRAKKWAVFSLNEPSLDFAAQSFVKADVPNPSVVNTLIIRSFLFTNPYLNNGNSSHKKMIKIMIKYCQSGG